MNSSNGTNTDGGLPVAGFLLLGNSLHGTTSGGCSRAAGTRFSLPIPIPPAIITGIVLNLNRSVTLLFLGGPNTTNIIQGTTKLATPSTWRSVSTNIADAGGTRQFIQSHVQTPHGFIVPEKSKNLFHVTTHWLAGISVALAIWVAQNKIVAADGHWVTTWGCGPQLTEPGNLPPVPLANSTLRQFVHVTLGGKHLRVRFSNAYGTNLVRINSAHVALSTGAGSAGNGDINTASDTALTFRGAPSVNLPPGEVILSDPFDYDLPALTNLAVSIYFGDISATTINGHPGSRTTSFIIASNVVTAASMTGAATTAHWYIITGVDVLADTSRKAVVTLGDSITDGRGSTTDGNDRWPDNLARRLATNTPAAGVAVVNMGIGGNAIFGGLGPAAVARFDRDVLNQSGARWLIVFEGVNDIGGATTAGSPALATNMIAAYRQFITKAHARNMRAHGATITPFGGNSYYTPAHEVARQTVNTWIRTNNLYDGVIDFDAIVRDPVTVTNLLPSYNSGDGLHLNPVGYQAMANAIDLTLFTP